jgi:stage II sporulation protein D
VTPKRAALLLLLGLPALVTPAVSPRFATRRILRLSKGTIETVPLEDYVAAVIPAEIGNAPLAALEAQAVAARSFALARWARHEDDDADLCDGTHCQVFRGLDVATPASRRAADATRGIVLLQNGRIVGAPFHASCGGHTARPTDVWDDEEMPDITPVADDACLGGPGASWTWRMPRSDVALLGRSFGIPDARWLEVFGRNDDGRVSMVRFAAPGGRSMTIRGFDFRRVANRLFGVQSVRSTAFELAETKSDYVLAGHGSGHGAGLCQVGAIARARRGETWEQILRVYYQGTSVGRIETLRASR